MALRRFQRRKSPKLNILKEGGDGVFKTSPKKEESKAEALEVRRIRCVQAPNTSTSFL